MSVMTYEDMKNIRREFDKLIEERKSNYNFMKEFNETEYEYFIEKIFHFVSESFKYNLSKKVSVRKWVGGVLKFTLRRLSKSKSELDDIMKSYHREKRLRTLLNRKSNV